MVQFPLNEVEKQLAAIIEDSNHLLRIFFIDGQEPADGQKPFAGAWVIGERLAGILLEKYSCQVEWEKEHIFGIWIAYVAELDLWGTGDTKEKAAEDLISAAEDYREIYLNCLSFWLGAGRQKHLPYVLRLALLRGNREKIKEFLGL